MNVLIAVDAAFAQNILICYFNVSVGFYTNRVGVHAKDVSVDGDQAYPGYQDARTLARTRARGDARACAYHMRARIHLRAYLLLLWQPNLLLW